MCIYDYYQHIITSKSTTPIHCPKNNPNLQRTRMVTLPLPTTQWHQTRSQTSLKPKPILADSDRRRHVLQLKLTRLRIKWRVLERLHEQIGLVSQWPIECVGVLHSQSTECQMRKWLFLYGRQSWVWKAEIDTNPWVIVSFAMFGLLWPVRNCTFCDGCKALEIDDRFRVNDLECVRAEVLWV